MDDPVAALIAKCAAADRAAFRALYRDTSAKLMGVLLRMLRERAEAEDALQEVYTRVWLRAGRYDPAKGRGMTWLIAIARNLAAALAAVHARNYVVGDLNEGNIFVNDQSLVTLIDTDSFQVRDPRSGWVYRCNVGKGAFTPVELQGLDLKSVDRQPYHDLFGLGVLLFHLLMEGYHPFTGVSRSQASISGQTVFERNIGQGNFPYHPGSSFLPPPAAPTYNILHPQLQAMFRRCFLDGHKTPSARPT